MNYAQVALENIQINGNFVPLFHRHILPPNVNVSLRDLICLMKHRQHGILHFAHLPQNRSKMSD